MPSIDSSMTVGVFKDESQAQQALASLKSAGFDQVQFLRPGRGAPQSGGLFSGIKRLFTGDNEGIAGNLTDTGVSEGDARYYQQEYEAGRFIITVRANGRKQDALDTLRRYGAYDAFKRDPQDTTATTSTTPTSETSLSSAATSTSETGLSSAAASTSGIASNAEIAQPSTAISDAEIARPTETSSTSRATQPSAPISNAETVQPAEMASASAPAIEQETEEGADTLLTPPTEDLSETYDRHHLTLNEEQLNVSKQPVQTGQVELHKEVVTEQRTLDVPVTHEEVVVKQHSVSSSTSDTTPIGQDEEIRVPVTKEHIEMTKTPVVTSEVTLEKRTVQETQRVSETTRREELRVEQEGDAPIHGTPSDRFHYDKQKQNQASKPRAKSRKKR